MCNQRTGPTNVRDYKVSSRTYQRGREAFREAITGRTCTWGASISKSKKGVSQGKRSKESISKQKETVSKNPYRHPQEIRQKISNNTKGVPKSKEHRNSMSISNKTRGLKPPTQSKKVTIDGITYSSIKEACEKLGIPRYKLHTHFTV